MKVIIPTALTLVSSSVPEDERPEWNSATNYTTGTEVQIGTLHKIFRATADNTNKNPPDNISAGAKCWSEVGFTAPYRMLDDKVNTRTEHVGSLTARVSYGSMPDSLVLVNAEAFQARVTQFDTGGAQVQQITQVMQSQSYTDWHDWIFGPERPIKDMVIPLQLYSGQTEVVLSQVVEAAVASCGMLLIGTTRDIGITRYGVKPGIRDYSRKSTDEWGNTYLKQGNYARTLTLDALVMNGGLDALMNQLAALRGVPAYFIGNSNLSDYGSLNLYGWISGFDIVVSAKDWSTLSIEITGLV